MTIQEILSKVDHTLLNQTATWEEIRQICQDAVFYETASVCIPPCYVKKAREYMKDRMKICTVIGFPNGYHTTEAKIFEAKNAIQDGADELDMVINIGALKEKNYGYVEKEIIALKRNAGSRILKVIVEACLLNEEEKMRMCKIITRAEADYIKTSTGFLDGGATLADIELFQRNVGEGVKIKAAGGIRSFEEAEKMIAAGASRLGTSSLVRLAKEKR